MKQWVYVALYFTVAFLCARPVFLAILKDSRDKYLTNSIPNRDDIVSIALLTFLTVLIWPFSFVGFSLYIILWKRWLDPIIGKYIQGLEELALAEQVLSDPKNNFGQRPIG
jgi:hypothetical protein